MEWSEAQRMGFGSGELLLWRRHGERSCTLAFIFRGRFWELSLSDQYQIQRARDADEKDHARLLPTRLDHRDHVVPFEDVSDQLGERCRRLIEDLELLEPRFEAGDSWLPVDSCYLLKHRVLGGLFVNPSKRSIATRVHARTEMMQWLWNHPGAFPSRPSLAELEAISPLLEKYTSFIDALKTGAVMLSLGSRGRVIFAHQRFLRLVDLTAESIERLLFNPYGLSLSTDRLVDWMLESETLELSPLPEALQLVRSRLNEEFSRPKSEIVEKYIARIKEGGPLSGGPTTDQSWTVRYEGGRFVISGYRPTSDGGLEQTLDPISEDEVRRMVGSYRMFGLSE